MHKKNVTRKITPYAFIRIHNEEYTLQACLDSISTVIKKGIIVYHAPLPGTEEDNSVIILKEWIKQNPGFKIIKYPHIVIPPHQIFHRIIDIPLEWRLDSYYQFALNELRTLAEYNGDYDSAYVVKIDCDQIYLPEALEDFFNYIRNDDKNNLHYFMYSLDVYFKNNRVTLKPNSHSNFDHYCIKLSNFPKFSYYTNEENFPSLSFPTKVTHNDIQDSKGSSVTFYDFRISSYFRYLYSNLSMQQPWWSNLFPYTLDENRKLTEPYLSILYKESWTTNICSYEILKVPDEKTNYLSFITSVHLKFNKYSKQLQYQCDKFIPLKDGIKSLIEDHSTFHTFNGHEEWFTELNLYNNVYRKLNPETLDSFQKLNNEVDLRKLIDLANNTTNTK